MTTPATQEPLRILGIQVENMLKLKAVSLKPDPNEPTVIVSGQNASGKSSLLNCIQIALGGKRMMVDGNGDKISEPVHRGAKHGRIFLDIGHLTTELTIECVLTAGSDDYKLVVRGKDGKLKASPQSLLNTLYNTVAFDPESFLRMKESERLETLQKLAGVDFKPLNEKRAKLYNERTVVGRLLEGAKARLPEFPFYPEAPQQPVSVEQAQAKLTAIRKQREQNAQVRNTVGVAKLKVASLGESITSLKAEIERLKKQLAEREQLLASKERELEPAQSTLNAAELAASKLVEDDEAETLAEVSNLNAINSKVQANKLHEQANADVQKHQAAYDQLTRGIEEVDQEKRDLVEWAEFPMPGLSFNDTQVLFEGIPLNQRSQAEQSRIAVAIAAALNPKLPVVLIRNGSLYDQKSLAAIKDEARKRKLHVWIEIVESNDPAAVVIEDGEVKA